ncbi:unnamed protein product, partial [Durusdinium trenchii]
MAKHPHHRPLPLGLGPTPALVMAPMVKQSDRAFRALVRAHGCTLCYTEMLMADEFGTDAMYRRKALGDRIDEEDHPLVVQFAANRAEDLLSAALAAQAMGADGIDINLGCPQRRAREGNYGAWLANEEKNWPLIGEMLKECVQCPALKIPVVCKIRLQHTLSATIKFAQLLEASGCALLTIHGRKLSGAPKHRDGPADLGAIAAVRQSLGIPVVSNGNVRRPEEVWRNLQCTGCEGIMCAEQLLHDPALFERGRTGPTTPRTSDPLKALTSPSAEELVDEYLGYCGTFGAEDEETFFSIWGATNGHVIREHVHRMRSDKGPSSYTKLGGKKRSLRALEEATDVEATPRVNKRSDLDLDRTPGKVFGFQKLRQAEPLYVRAYEGQKSQLGAASPVVMQTAVNLAGLKQARGLLDEAEALDRE